MLTTLDCLIQVDSMYTDFSSFEWMNETNLLHWFSFHLINTSQIVSVNGFQSTPYVTTSSMPQGSHLRPLLFDIYLNDIRIRFQYSKFLFCADDIKIGELDFEANWFEYCTINRLFRNTDTHIYYFYQKYK